MALAELEAEVFILGNWKNFDELEECLNLDELSLLINSSRKAERERQKFAAALKGVDLDSESNDTKKKIEDVQRRANARLAGIDEDKFDELELIDLGISFTEEE